MVAAEVGVEDVEGPSLRSQRVISPLQVGGPTNLAVYPQVERKMAVGGGRAQGSATAWSPLDTDLCRRRKKKLSRGDRSAGEEKNEVQEQAVREVMLFQREKRRDGEDGDLD